MEELGRELAHILAFGFALTHSQTADGKSIESHFGKASCAFPSQFREERALHNTEDRLF